MTVLLAILCVILIVVVAVQIGKVTDIASRIRGEEEAQYSANSTSGILLLIFMIAFLIVGVGSAIYYKNYMMGFGPNDPASEHGGALDRIFNITLFFTGVVFIITQVLLFYFAWKYRGKKGSKAVYISHDNRLEILWTVIPAAVMTLLVIGGLDAWNEVMADIPEDAVVGEDYIEFEATGMQFAWLLRYPGSDNKLGTRDFNLISGANPLGQDWTDMNNVDDFHPNEIVLPVGKQVRVRITSRDVLHSFFLPHFRVKMDAVPGMPTYFVFTPKLTTSDYRMKLKEYDEFNVPADPADSESPMLWEVFEYELACAELCGSGHYSMRKIVKIVSEDEYNDWYNKQESYYMSNIRNTEDDPHGDRLFDMEIKQRKEELVGAVKEALGSEDEAKRIVDLKYVTFETGAASLTPLSRYELENLAEILTNYPDMNIEIGGHTDNTGTPEVNLGLSQQRAQVVYDYLVQEEKIEAERLTAVGYGQTSPRDTNETEKGRSRNRRTEFKIL